MATRDVLLIPLGEASFTETNPFEIAEEIRAISGEIDSCKPLPTGSLLVKTATSDQIERLLQTTRFLGLLVRCTSADKHHTVEAVAFVTSLVKVTEEEIVAQLRPQSVVSVMRLRPKDGKIKTGLRFCFEESSHPKTIKAGFETIKLRTWQRSPMLCRHCARYGHTAGDCRSSTAQCLRCTGPHATNDCACTTRLCPHCGGPHAAWERSCPVLGKYFKKEERQLTTRHQTGVPVVT